eukprot:CAMPEP_0114989396 /NCGR_PEP_ID=MMETSP0216-20121206/10173_1 /TAXON_ID=223996 /ORGANISM="Protocruzia adherens, Strain Boccale" /LENGTH=357 /DNA_ID=CAMNT_0002352367 /DNA_START=37 /DNA_END=1110 /DNA_ORIENTATION=+
MYASKTPLVRNPTLRSSLFNRVANREHVLKSTYRQVKDSATGAELHILGTMNCSNLTARRTRHLIRDIKPDTVVVQSDEGFWDVAKHLDFVESQEEMNVYKDLIDESGRVGLGNNLRTFFFRVKWGILKSFLNILVGNTYDHNVLRPGLEVKYALEEAQKAGSKVINVGRELDSATYEKLFYEKRMDPINIIFRSLWLNVYWYREIMDNRRLLLSSGVRNYTESVMDNHRIAWWKAFGENLLPYVKRVFVENRDEEIFYQLIREQEGKVTVAVVNQHHMEGLEEAWKHYHGIRELGVPIDPTGDMNISEGVDYVNLSNARRNYVKDISGISTSSLSNYVTAYSMETNFHYTHRFADG